MGYLTDCLLISARSFHVATYDPASVSIDSGLRFGQGWNRKGACQSIDDLVCIV